MLELESDHRRHAEVENVIRDLKYGVGLNHLPSAKFAANAAWLTLNVIAPTWPAGPAAWAWARPSSPPRPYGPAT